MINVSGSKTVEMKRLAETALPDIEDQTVAKVARVMRMPRLMDIQRRKRAELKVLESKKKLIESTEEYKNAEFRLDPKDGELTRRMEEYVSERAHIIEKLRDFYGHPDFIELRNGRKYGLLAAVIVGIFGIGTITVGVIAHMIGWDAGAITFTALGTVGLFGSVAVPPARRKAVADYTARELSCRDFKEGQELFRTLNQRSAELARKIAWLEEMKLRMQYHVLQHKKTSEQICVWKREWLNELRQAAFGVEPTDVDEEIDINIDIEIEVDRDTITERPNRLHRLNVYRG